MITIKEGNILKAEENIICHQVNCQGVMGSGLALDIRWKYPDAYYRYKALCHNGGSPLMLLGVTQLVDCNGKIIANMFGQLNYGTDKQQTDYKALERCFKFLNKTAKERNLSVAIPYGIGCGLGGGDWNVVYKMIEESFDIDVTIYKFDKRGVLR